MDDGQRKPLGLFGNLVTENLAEQLMDNWVEAFLTEAVTVLFGLPDVDVTEAPLGTLQGYVGDQALGRGVTQPIHDALVELRIDRYVLRERVGHGWCLRDLIRIDIGAILSFMVREVKGHRYDGSLRRERSGERRQRIVEAARDLMIERGYRATKVSDIAARAGVNVDTVYELVGRKSILLRELIEQAISGVDHAVVAEERGYVVAMRAEPDPVKKLITYAHSIRETQERLAPLLLALREASSTDPEAERVWKEISDRRAANMRSLVGHLRDAGGIRSGLSVDEAADVVWATNSPELFVMLTRERGWSPDKYEQWLGDAWCRLLLN
jgi:AcrR family transcriptional regulator